jgi:hypothetical protein
MGLSEIIETCVTEAQETYQEENPDVSLRHIGYESETLWHKIDHLLYLPILGLSRPRDLYYYQGHGLQVLYGFTYKYLTLEHFLGQLTRLQVGYPLADALAYCYAQAWYPDNAPLYLFTDWHVKPHWTKHYAHSGHVTMWGKTMPGTKQLFLNGTDGHLLGGWNYPIDTHLTHVLVDLEAALSETLQRPIICNVMDSEGGGLPIAERYAEAKQCYLSLLPRQHDHPLTSFELQGHWQPVIDDPSREAVFARWAEAEKAATDPRRFVLLRPIGQRELTRIYAGCIPADLPAGVVPWLHRQRWANNELRIRELVNGANLNENYGYTYAQVLNRTRQRQWQVAQAKVEVTQGKLNQQQEAVKNLRHQLHQLQQAYTQRHTGLQQTIAQQRYELIKRRRLGKPTKRAHNRLCQLKRELAKRTTRFHKWQRYLLQQFYHRQTQAGQLRLQLAERKAIRDAIDTETLCRERHLEKDQVMLDLQFLLTNLHDWAKQHYFAPQWQHLTLEKAIQLIYRKPGQVSWYPDRIEVVLDSYRYREQQQDMKATCQRFNEANLRWQDGRLLRISVRDP